MKDFEEFERFIEGRIEIENLDPQKIIRILAEILGTAPQKRQDLKNSESLKRKIGWYKSKLFENPGNLARIKRLSHWLAKQPGVSINQKAVLGAMIRGLENYRRRYLLQQQKSLFE